MFSLFKKSPPATPYIDKVWKSEEFAHKGMLMMAMVRLQQRKSALIVSFFESEITALSEFMQATNLQFSRLDDSVSMQGAEPTIYLAKASELSHPRVNEFLRGHAAQFSGEVFFSSHYPKAQPEEKLLQELSAMNFKHFIFCLSFDDPLLKTFGSEKILPLLEKLGLEDEEAVEHAMVTQSIKGAREKIESKVISEVQTKSPEEWFALNVKK
jgi:hypothetical protein